MVYISYGEESYYLVTFLKVICYLDRISGNGIRSVERLAVLEVISFGNAGGVNLFKPRELIRECRYRHQRIHGTEYMRFLA